MIVRKSTEGGVFFYAAGVINADTDERGLTLADIYRKLAEAEKQSAEGVLVAVELFVRLRRKYGL